MSDPTEEALETIKAMGFTQDEEQIREALRRCDNNPQEAVQFLLPDSPTSEPNLNLMEGFRDIDPSHYRREDSRDSYDIDMRDTETHPGSGADSDHDSTTVSYSIDEDAIHDIDDEGAVLETGRGGGEEEEFRPIGGRNGKYVYSQHRHEVPPPRYEDIVTDNQGDSSPPPPLEEHVDDTLPTPTPPDVGVGSASEMTSSIEFPLTHYYELEGRVHTDQWSIPYKRDESLAICMVAVIRMVMEGPGIAEGDENCKKFLEKTLPDSFSKLITHDAVFRWDQPIMEGILDMSRILMELIAERLKQKPIPIHLLHLLNMTFNADANYHNKMKTKRTDHTRWSRVLGEKMVFAQMPHFHTNKDPKGWLVEIMNVFAQHGGIEAVKEAVHYEDITLQELTALFQPFSSCEDYINPIYLKSEFSKAILRAIRYINALSDESLKDKEVGCVSDLLKALKTLLLRCSVREMAATVDTLRLGITIRMLNIPHFNAKMNALKEVVRLTEEPYQAAARGVRSPIPAERVTEWLVQEKVLSIALQGNLHQSQYCEKIKSIVEFLGQQLSMEELTTMWEMQVDKNPVQIENVHGLIAAAASRSTPNHLDHLFQLIKKSWEESVSDRYREKLLELIGKIGKDDRQGKTASKILELLWSLAHLPQLSREMVELALESHSAILIDSYHTKEAEKKNYISKCVEDIKKSQWVVSGLRQLHRFARGFCKSGYGHKDQHQVAELQRQHDLIRITCMSLIKMHTRAVEESRDRGVELSGALLVDGRYTHREYVEVHLQFLAFLLQDGALYMPNKRAVEVWDTLIANQNACEDDRELAFKWFDSGMNDLEHETQTMMFKNCVLKVDPSRLNYAGYFCLKNFFENINLVERKLKRMTSSYQALIVESLDLTGLDYLWRAALEVRDVKIADDLISNILQISYQGLSSRLKKDLRNIHIRFIDECFHRLEDLTVESSGGGGSSRTSTGYILDPDLRYQAVERLLLLAQRYICIVEESHHFLRTIPPHGSSFQGHHMVLTIAPEQQQKPEFSLDCHSNESIFSIKHKTAQRLGVLYENLTMGMSDRWFDSVDNNKLIGQLHFEGPPTIIVKIYGGVTGSYSRGVVETAEGNAQRQALANEQERNLPGVILASREEFFLKVEELCASGNARVIRGVHTLLMLVPTNRKVAQALEVFATPPSEGGGASEDSQEVRLSPQAVLEQYFSTSLTSSTQLLYNLEVLSSFLIPTSPTTLPDHQKEAESDGVLMFRRNFLEHGGLKSVINVLQRDAFPSNVDLTTRQDCYAIALTLARFLLCNQTMLPPVPRVPFRQHSSASQSSAVGEDEGATPTVTPSISKDDSDEGMELPKLTKGMSMEDEAARLSIEMMSVSDFGTMLAHLIRVCWSASAGQLHLASTEASPSPSSPSGGEDSKVRTFICVDQENDAVSSKTSAIARESLELLMTCLRLRSTLLNIFYTLPLVEEFVVDVLLGCPHMDVRLSMGNQLIQLCRDIDTESLRPPFSDTTPVKRLKTVSIEAPKHFVLKLLLKHTESLWGRGLEEAVLPEWERSSQYFELLCNLLHETKPYEKESCGVDVLNMLSTELRWLEEVLVPPPPCHAFQTLLAGHLHLCRTLFTCEGIDKLDLGADLSLKLVCDYLFPASRMIMDSDEPRQGIVNISPTCVEVSTRVAAYDLLVELCTDSYNIFDTVSKQLVTMHHKPSSQLGKEWEYQPPVVGRSSCRFVGLKNAGATCYMNSVLQQLYMTSPIRETILGSERDGEDESILPELQCVFGHLMQSKLQYYSPESFWKKFKLWGQPVNVREQQDAFDFFCNLTDQVDEQMKKKSSTQIFQKMFGGIFLDQKICRGCEHTYDREESFLSLSLPVSSRKLEESLKEFVKGDLLEGDNAYFCEKCGEKRDTLKRMCIKTLPPVLMVHLKRFDYDWEANRAIKYDDHFEFPWLLDMEPYTNEGISRVEERVGEEGKPCRYELKGMVVHSGQASAGHYYSFIKEKRSPTHPSLPEDVPMVTPLTDRWLRFNDVDVDEFLMSDVTVETECFGGTYKPKQNEVHSTHGPIENRTRFWNAYMLFYERLPSSSDHDNKEGERLAPLLLQRGKEGGGVIPGSPLSPLPDNADKLTQLQALVQKGERRHMFSDSMPADIQRSVNEENLLFMRHRDVYCPEYFEFIHRLAMCNTDMILNHRHPRHGGYGVTAIQLAMNFFFHTYFRTKKSLRVDLALWARTIKQLLTYCRDACAYFVEFLASSEGTSYLKPFLLECTNREVRAAFCTMLSHACHSYNGTNLAEGPVSVIVDSLLQLLEKDVIDHSKTCAEYFDFFKNHASQPQGCKHLLDRNAFVLMVEFLLGPSPKTTPATTDSAHPPDKAPRRWSSNQVKEFDPLHGSLSLMVRNTDISAFETENESGDEVLPNPYMIPGEGEELPKLHPPSDGMHQALFAIEYSKRFIRECVLTLRDSDTLASDAIGAMFCYCCWNNQSFSACTIEDLQLQISLVPSNEIKNYFKVMTELLLIEDFLQQKRISFAITGGKYKPQVSIFQTIQSNSSSSSNSQSSDSKKTYQGIKFLVGLANKCQIARDFLLSHASEWQWTVSWLRRKMSDHYSWSSNSLSNESGGSRVFHRTVSAQDTLEEANALLNELDARNSKQQQQAPPIVSGPAPNVPGDKLNPDISTSNTSMESGTTPPRSSINQIEG